MFADFGLGRGWSRSATMPDSMTWTPQIEVSQRNNELVVRADLPGMRKDDVKVDVTDDAITIQGERRREHEEEHGVAASKSVKALQRVSKHAPDDGYRCSRWVQDSPTQPSRVRNCENLIVIDKEPQLQWLDIGTAMAHWTRGASTGLGEHAR